jgi:hypothetical protein
VEGAPLGDPVDGAGGGGGGGGVTVAAGMTGGVGGGVDGVVTTAATAGGGSCVPTDELDEPLTWVAANSASVSTVDPAKGEDAIAVITAVR